MPKKLKEEHRTSWLEVQHTRVNVMKELQHCQSAHERLAMMPMVVLITFYSVVPPTRAGVIRQLIWNQSLVCKRMLSGDEEEWYLDLGAMNHKTSGYEEHSNRVLPLSSLLHPLLREWYSRLSRASVSPGGRPVFPNTAGEVHSEPSWTTFVASTFQRYHPRHKAIPPSKLRQSFVTFLYSFDRSTKNDPILQSIKDQAARFMLHSTAIADRVYNQRDLETEEMRPLIEFCDAYARRFNI